LHTAAKIEIYLGRGSGQWCIAKSIAILVMQYWLDKKYWNIFSNKYCYCYCNTFCQYC